MEICRKLDSIRTSGFPDAEGVATTGGVAAAGGTGDAVDFSGPPPPRPRSEPLPESILAVETLSEEGRRPGTAASRSGSIAAAAAAAATGAASLPRGESHGGVGTGGTSTAGENGNKVDGALVGEEEGGVRNNGSSSGSSSASSSPPTDRPNHRSTASDIGAEELMLEAAEASGSGGGTAGIVDSESADVDHNTAEGHHGGSAAAVVAQPVRTGAKKPSSMRRDKVGGWFLYIVRKVLDILHTYQW